MKRWEQKRSIPEMETTTTIDQDETEQLVRKAYKERLDSWKQEAFRLFRHNHVTYLTQRLASLPSSFDALDASQTWIAYWIVHSLALLNVDLSEEQGNGLIKMLKSCQHISGGFGGGPHQLPHLATTYGAVNCLCLLRRDAALDVIDRKQLIGWLHRLHQPDGSFTMHEGGEVDVRGAYCAAAVASLLGLDLSVFDGTPEWIASCQTYEGGFGGLPGLEAHGGYTFCAFAALLLLGRPDLIDLPRLLHWVAHRQMAVEGGFQGRTNKLVDSCYSFWVGAIFTLIQTLLFESGDEVVPLDNALFDSCALQEYVLLCCQKVPVGRSPATNSSGTRSRSVSGSSSGGVTSGWVEVSGTSSSSSGGLIDKPGKNPDPYHTCYSLSGLSVAQHFDVGPSGRSCSGAVARSGVVGEEFGNELQVVHPLHNLPMEVVQFAWRYYERRHQLNSD